MYMMPFDDSAAAAVIGNRTMPIVDELADSNTIDFGYCCMYACVTQVDLRCFDFGASISTLHTKLAGASRSWDRWYLWYPEIAGKIVRGQLQKNLIYFHIVDN